MKGETILHKHTKTRNRTRGIFEWILFAVLLLYALSIVYLIFWGLLTSLKDQGDFRQNVFGLPKVWAFENFAFVYKNFTIDIVTTEYIKRVNIFGLVVNTFLYAGVGAVIQVFTTCLVAYITCKYNYRICKIVFTAVVVTMILPIVGAFPSELQMLKFLNLYDTFWGNWIQKLNVSGVYYLVFYAAFKAVANDFYDAARIDGASELRVMTHIMLPLVKTTISTIVLILFIGFWNDYQTPLLYLPSHPTLAFGVFTLSTSRKPEFNNVPMRMAGCMFLLIPILVLYIFMRKKLMGNLSMGGIKE